MTWRCPACGLRAEDPTQGYRGAPCSRCGVPLVLDRDDRVPVAFTCPWCGGTVDANARRCSHCARSYGVPRCDRCGAAVDLADDTCRQCEAPILSREHASALTIQCPVCLRPLEEQILGNGVVLACGTCHGLFAAQELLDRWTANRGAEAPEELPSEPPVPSDGRVRYRRCPRCAVWMNRVNFGPGSGIVLDVCRTDGVWFDGGELPAAVEFACAGRLDAARERHRREREANDRRQLPAKSPLVEVIGAEQYGSGTSDSLVAAILRGLFGF